MAIQDLITQVDSNPYGITHDIALGQPDADGNYYGVADLPSAPTGMEWFNSGMGHFALIPSASVPAYQAYVDTLPTRAQQEAQSKEASKWAQVAQERANASLANTDPEIVTALIEAYNREADKPYAGQPMKSPLDPTYVPGIDNVPMGSSQSQNPYTQALYDLGFFHGGPKTGMGGDMGFTGGNIQAGQQAMGKAADTAQSNYQASLASMSQPGYGAGEVARAEAREAAQAKTPSYSMTDAQAEAATKASPAMQGLEEVAGLPTAPLVPPTPSLADNLSKLLKSVTPSIVDKAKEVGSNLLDVGKSIGSTLTGLATPSTSTPPTPSRTDTTAMPTPYSVPDNRPNLGNIGMPTPPKTPAPYVSPTATKKGPYKASLAPALTAKLRNEGLNRNIEYGYNKLATPFGSRSDYARPGRGMAGMS